MIEVKMKDPAGVILTTAGKKCNQNIKVVPGFDIPEEYNGEYEFLVPTVSGVWVFDDSAPENDGKAIEQSVNFSFEANEGVVTCNKMEISGYGELYYQPYTDETDGTAAYDSSWCLSQTVDFGTTPQPVSVEFYAWLTANAVKQ